MGILNIFGKKSVAEQGWRVGGMEDFMTLIRVYYQAVMAANLGINNLAALPDLRLFKQTLHVPTVNNKLGLGEKNRCKKLLSEIYGISDNFFKEIDMSIKRNCKNLNSVQPYFFCFPGILSGAYDGYGKLDEMEVPRAWLHEKRVAYHDAENRERCLDERQLEER